MLPQEKGTILEIEHKITRDIPLSNKHHAQALVYIKIDISTDSFYYTDEKHSKMINEIQEVIKKYI